MDRQRREGPLIEEQNIDIIITISTQYECNSETVLPFAWWAGQFVRITAVNSR